MAVEIRVNEKFRMIYPDLSDYLSKSFHLSMELGYLEKLAMKLIFNPILSEKISLPSESIPESIPDSITY